MRASSRAHGISASMRCRKRSRRVWRGCPSYSTSANERCGCIVALTGSPSSVSIGPAATTRPFFRAFLECATHKGYHQFYDEEVNMRSLRWLLLMGFVVGAFVAAPAAGGDVAPQSVRDAASDDRLQTWYQQIPPHLKDDMSFEHFGDLTIDEVKPNATKDDVLLNQDDTLIQHEIIKVVPRGPASTGPSAFLGTYRPGLSGPVVDFDHWDVIRCAHQSVREAWVHWSGTYWCYDGHEIVPYPDPMRVEGWSEEHVVWTLTFMSIPVRGRN